MKEGSLFVLSYQKHKGMGCALGTIGKLWMGKGAPSWFDNVIEIWVLFHWKFSEKSKFLRKFGMYFNIRWKAFDKWAEMG
jgi:hypothetical protein